MEFNRLVEKRPINLLFLLHKRKRIHSSDLMVTGANYTMVHERALELQERGIVISFPDDHRSNRTNWELTSRGNAIVLLLLMSTYVTEDLIDYRAIFPNYIVKRLDEGDVDGILHDMQEMMKKDQ